ncbi:hypothetical protein [Microbacterium sp. KR10-403]|uniref:hypothetical protein n=1 Tax=Microbacterium sp. KR10-403 TaxID=3158581 RepID=UPI0032E4E8D4
MAKFHIAKDGQTKPCTATVKACPLGEANHFGSLEEAVAHAMEAERTHMLTMPAALRRFFFDDDEQGSIFDEERALVSFAAEELSTEKYRAFRKDADWHIAEIGLTTLASRSFTVEDWVDSLERETLAQRLPITLRALEEEAITAADLREVFA